MLGLAPVAAFGRDRGDLDVAYHEKLGAKMINMNQHDACFMVRGRKGLTVECLELYLRGRSFRRIF